MRLITRQDIVRALPSAVGGALVYLYFTWVDPWTRDPLPRPLKLNISAVLTLIPFPGAVFVMVHGAAQLLQGSRVRFQVFVLRRKQIHHSLFAVIRTTKHPD